MFRIKLIVVLVFSLLLASCGGGDAEGTVTPTLSADEIQTLAVETFSAALTQTALAAPSDTPFPTLTASPTFAPFATSTGGTAPSGSNLAPTASCYRLAFVSDVTIPDNTAMTPGQTFTKTWKVSNTGSCVWDAGFKFAFVSGDAMSGATYTLPLPVPANGILDISIPMTAPTNKTGIVRGDWRMSTAGGQAFGDIVYVQIVIGGATGTPPTSMPGTATSTSTSTPVTVTATTQPAP